MARLANKDDPEAKISDLFEALIAKGAMEFHKVELEDLPDAWSRNIVSSFLVSNNLEWSLGDVKLDGAVCVKVEDDFLQYIDIFPSKLFSWATNNHHDGVHPDEALIYMLNKGWKQKDESI